MLKLVVIAGRAYQQAARDPNFEPEKIAAVWHQSLALTGGTSIPYACWEKALAGHIQRSKWFPTLAELVEQVRAIWQEERPKLEAAPEPRGDLIPPDDLSRMAGEVARKMRMP